MRTFIANVLLRHAEASEEDAAPANRDLVAIHHLAERVGGGPAKAAIVERARARLRSLVDDDTLHDDTAAIIEACALLLMDVYRAMREGASAREVDALATDWTAVFTGAARRE